MNLGNEPAWTTGLVFSLDTSLGVTTVSLSAEQHRPPQMSLRVQAWDRLPYLRLLESLLGISCVT